MKKLTYILPLFISTLIMSCGNAETETSETSEEGTSEKGGAPEATVENTYSIDPSTAVVKWTAFKLAEKVGVEGEFKSYAITGHTDNAATIVDMMTGAEITLDVSSTKTGDEARDGKIINSFFGSMTGTEQVVASIVSMTGEDKGTAQVQITMNDASVTNELEWIYRDDLKAFILQGIINVPDWNAQGALDALNKVCEEKHQGTGDKAVTWPDVEVKANVKVIVNPAEGV